MTYLKSVELSDADALYPYISTVLPDENGFINEYFGCARETFEADVLQNMIDHSHGINLPVGHVPGTEYFLWVEDMPVGWFRLRHYLCPSLVEGAGHIGYSIREGYRGRGYATIGLYMLLDVAKSIVPEDEFYLRVLKSNPASLHVMIKNGGTIHHEDAEHYFVRIKK